MSLPKKNTGLQESVESSHLSLSLSQNYIKCCFYTVHTLHFCIFTFNKKYDLKAVFNNNVYLSNTVTQFKTTVRFFIRTGYLKPVLFQQHQNSSRFAKCPHNKRNIIKKWSKVWGWDFILILQGCIKLIKSESEDIYKWFYQVFIKDICKVQIHAVILGKKISNTTVFNIDNNKCFLSIKSTY